MPMLADTRMPPRPQCEFVFDLPHGVDLDEMGESNHQEDNQIAGEILQASGHVDEPFDNDQDYDAFALSFLDDEGGEADLARSDNIKEVQIASQKNKKSLRRSDASDGGNEASAKAKRPRTSLFGGPVEEHDQENENDFNNQGVSLYASEARTSDFRPRSSSLNLDQQAGDAEVLQDAQDSRAFESDFGLAALHQGSVSPATTRALSEESFIIPSDDQPVYELRKNIDRAKAFTNIDTDNTGNYDPLQEARLEALRLRRAKAAKATKKKGKGKQKVRKEHIPKFIVIFQFEAFGNVRNYTNDEDNWPKDWSDVDTEYEEEARDYREYYRRNTPDIDIQLPIEDPGDLLEDLTGHPSARGCKHCRVFGRNCTMVEGGSFPCEECEDEDVLCEPIIRPSTKGRCKQCADDGQDVCSFEDDPEQLICTQCTDGQFVCEALPSCNYKASRISIDKILYGPNRKHIQCTFCRVEKMRCSLKEKTEKPPCKHCKKYGIGCTFYDIPKPVTAKQAAAAKRKKSVLYPLKSAKAEVSKPSLQLFSTEDLEDLFRTDDAPILREATPEQEMMDEAGNKGMLTKIHTSFAHPIQFNVEVGKADDCNFCEFPMFGLIGHFEREVHVIAWYSGLGYTEVGSGYCEDKGATTMCTRCTMDRIQIILCEGHEFESLSDEPNLPDVEVVAHTLMDAETGTAEMRYQLQRFCSMCFSVARWGCAMPQPTLHEDVDEESCIGCGLRLCNKCLESLEDVFERDFDKMVAAMASMRKSTEEDGNTDALQGNPRADVGLLLQEGLLLKNVGAEHGMDDEM